MARNIKTHIICFDDHRGFTEEVRKRFADPSKYSVMSYLTREQFLGQIEKEPKHNICKVAIIGIHDTREQVKLIFQLTSEIKKTDPGISIILLCPHETMEEIKKTVKFNVEAYIPVNANTIIRIHNTVRKLKSEHNIMVFRKRRNISLYILLIFILLLVFLVFMAYNMLPQYF
jgi:DNA-binding NarL/FixJ family response regulator